MGCITALIGFALILYGGISELTPTFSDSWGWTLIIIGMALFILGVSSSQLSMIRWQIIAGIVKDHPILREILESKEAAGVVGVALITLAPLSHINEWCAIWFSYTLFIVGCSLLFYSAKNIRF